jgi:hypothetical protein
MKENWNDLSDEEKAEIRKRTPIAHDDPTATCTKAGWERSRRTTNGHQVMKPDVPFARFWCATWNEVEVEPKTKTEIVKARVTLVIECERFNDARAYAVMRAGGNRVEIVAGMPSFPRAQVKWLGMAMNNTLHMVHRIVENESHQPQWGRVNQL